MIIGITGSSGAGKSTACEILSEKYDIEIIDADKIARKLTDTVKDNHLVIDRITDSGQNGTNEGLVNFQ